MYSRNYTFPNETRESNETVLAVIALTFVAATTHAQTIDGLRERVRATEAQNKKVGEMLTTARNTRCPLQQNPTSCRIDYTAANTIVTRIRMRLEKVLLYADAGNFSAASDLYNESVADATKLNTEVKEILEKYPAR